MSKYDEEYQAHFTGLRGYKLYAHGTFYAKNIEYNPVKKEILVGPTSHFGAHGLKWFKKIEKLGFKNKIKFFKIRNMYPRYELYELAQHPAIVIFPYAVMTYSIVDFYASNLPIFVPSIKILAKSKSVFDRPVTFEPFCGRFETIKPINSSIHSSYDPNSNEYDDFRLFLSLIIYFYLNICISFLFILAIGCNLPTIIVGHM